MKKIIIAGLMTTLFMVTSSFAEEITYSKHIKPVITHKCMKCHGSDAPEYKEFKKDKKKFISMKKGPRMDSYTHMVYFIGWPDTGAMMRRLDDGSSKESGKPGNMYKNLGDTEEERQRNLSLFKAWIGSWTLNRWSAVSKDDISKMTLTY
jgi:hypothetical protein